MSESPSTSTANAARSVSVREALDELEKWRALPPHERLGTHCPDTALEAVIAYCRQCLDKGAVNSRTSGVPPSQDQNRPRGSTRKDKGKRKPGGQPGHKGTTAEWSGHPDVRVECSLDYGQLPEGPPTAPKLLSCSSPSTSSSRRLSRSSPSRGSPTRTAGATPPASTGAGPARST